MREQEQDIASLRHIRLPPACPRFVLLQAAPNQALRLMTYFPVRAGNVPMFFHPTLSYPPMRRQCLLASVLGLEKAPDRRGEIALDKDF